ncbi:hypothetical protein LTR35_005987 [Friedmanniomyces endolithicus]|uniref:Glycine zipper 2TM domain-containing protein n=1 Tax=Friedmanniomyces endolithicus TaxID=329885 RepID=A0AAN6JKC6_9PEZI|nr:hypothetical protein LTR35_005987 [Friedmanniomyces endolithicus]KAK0300777.1 hypothetical protein LTS00_001035 [Friedmanniomyces endolithicus]KAK0327528.1 hypothetical protein LTR82_001043 [Friedmanniomyces endolithicus]KAK1018016.1 hypothetical protein LTR54_001862 [Friedmanniomyces endolithicus]
MAEGFVELGVEAVNHVTENHWDTIHDTSRKVIRKGTGRENTSPPPSSAGGGYRGRDQDRDQGRDSGKDQGRDQRDTNTNVSRRKYRNELPSPERERGTRDDSLERQSETSARVTSAYRNERDDPIRPVDPALERRRRRDSAKMAYANGYGARDERGHSAQPPKSRYYDDDGDSDYDDREGRRYKSGGARGYDDRDDERGYDREVIETERYRGPARPQDSRRQASYGSRAQDGLYGAGAVAPYNRRSQNDLTQVSRRTRSRGNADRDRSYSRSRSRSDSRDKDKEGWRGKLDEHFDTSMQGLGVGLAGAVAGALAGRQFGKQHKERDILVGALIGGLGANLAENKYKDFQEEREEKKQRGGRREQRYEGDYGRSRSQGR